MFWGFFFNDFFGKNRVEIFRVGYSMLRPWWPVDWHNFRI